jgi:copper transport protein
MTGMVRAPRRIAALVGVLCGLFLALLPFTPAHAHAVLVRTSPAQGAVVAAAPAEVVLTFSEQVSVVPAKTRIIAPDGTRADTGPPVARNGTVAIPLRSGGAQGTYLVNYRVISADSHPVGGTFTYSVGAPSATPPSVPDESSGTSLLVRTLLAVAKYLGYAGLILVAGPALVLVALWPRRLPRRRPTQVAWLGLGLIALGAVLELILQAPYETGTSLAGITGAALRDVFGSSFGTLHLVRLAVAGAAAVLLRPVLRGEGGPIDRALLAVLALVGLATWPLSGHPAASPVPAVTVLADAAHVAGMAVWIGGLVMLFGFLLRQADEGELAAILPIWARWAALSAGGLLVAGVLQALIEVGTVSALFRTSYGQLVVTKTVLFGAVLAVAWFSRRLVLGKAAATAPGRLSRFVAVELGGTVVILALASALVQQTPARDAVDTEDAGGPQLYSTTLTSKLYSLQVEIEPLETGNNSVHLYAYRPNGTPQPVVEWKGTAELASAGLERVDIPLLTITQNHSIGTVVLPTAGSWEFSFTLRVSDVDRDTVSTTVQVK